MGSSAATSAFLWGWLAWFATGAGAEIFRLERVRAPDRFTLNSYYAFQLYAPEDSPGSQSSGKPELALEDIQVEWTQKPDKSPYKSLEAAVIPQDKFFSLIRADNFCGPHSQQLILNLDGTSKTPWFDAGVAKSQLGGWSKLTPHVKSTGTWVLVFSNCGNSTGAEVSGRISLRHPYGFLPAAEYWTMKAYGLFSVAYAVVASLWLLTLIRQGAFQYTVPTGLLAVVVIAFLECFSTYLMCWFWNMSGIQNEALATGMLLFNSLKYVFALRLLLEVGSCQGHFKAEEDGPYPVKFYCVATVFLVQQCVSKMLLQSRHVFMLERASVLATNAFGSLICFGIFAWVFRKYGITDEWESRAGKNDPFIKLFTSTRRVLMLTFGIATGVAVVQLADIIWDSTPWELQWIPHDGVPHLTYLIFTILMMLIWWPDLDIWKIAYTQQVATHEGEDNNRPENGPEVAETIEDHEEEEQVFVDGPPRRSERVVQPDIVGASSRPVDEDGKGNLLDLDLE